MVGQKFCPTKTCSGRLFMALSTEITTQLKQYLAKLNSNVVIEAFVDESEVSTNMSELLV